MRSFFQSYSEKGIYKEAAALTFVTLLGFIPFLIFLLFLLPELPFLKVEANLSELLLTVFLPSSAEKITEFIQQLTTQKIPFNFFSFIILLFSSFSLFKIINDSFDNILNVHEMKRKDFLNNFVKFLGMTLFGGLLILILFSATSLPFVSKFFNLGLLQRLSVYITPFVLLFLVFSLGFLFIPSVKVQFKSIVIGASCASITWIIIKSLFNWYIEHLTNIEIIFGVLSFVPIFLFWIYTNWIIILSGVVIVSILENRYIRREAAYYNNPRIKVTFEKLIDRDELSTISSTHLDKNELKDIIEEVITQKDIEKANSKQKNSLQKKP
ncbi:MAG: YhjD/YihY/BrkB family envelope integrity protein [Candidatus Cloacimonadota bacterium]|nr:YhjD/YihY/BrkB family envelope integrity protein [Candidatus Cloacimonadota bacterium]